MLKILLFNDKIGKVNILFAKSQYLIFFSNYFLLSIYILIIFNKLFIFLQKILNIYYKYIVINYYYLNMHNLKK